MAKKEERKRASATNPVPGDPPDADPRPDGDATLGGPTRTRRELEEEVAEFRRNVRRRGNLR